MVASPPKAPPSPSYRSAKKELLLFLLIPTTVIAIVAALVILPSFFAKPGYDFIYSVCQTYDCSYDYGLSSSGTVTKNDLQERSLYYNESPKGPNLYYHSTSSNSSRPIEFSATYSLSLDASNVSPDGYRLSKPGYGGGGGFLFWGGSSDTNWYLVNGIKKKRVNLASNDYYSDDVNFIGWVRR